METIYLAGGCFWCTEAVFRSLKGVFLVVPGYTGGHVKNPKYSEVCSGETGHAEVVKIEYDTNILSTEDLLDVFFETHDPTSLDKQGADRGNQYRSAIFYTKHEQKDIADKKIAELNKKFIKDGKKVLTEVSLVDDFYSAEDYHHNYYENNKDKMYCNLVINPKLNKLKEKFGHFLAKE